MILSIIVPIYNEAESVEGLLDRVLQAPLPSGWQKEIVAINDGSTDGTDKILGKYTSKMRVLHQANGGKGAAVKKGLGEVTGDYVVIQDADLEYDPYQIEKLLDPIIKGKGEVVFGSRVLGQNNVSYSRVYYYGGLLLTKVFNLCFRASLTDLATCYKVFPGRFSKEIAAFPSNDFTFDVVELSYFLVKHAKIIEVPISYAPRSKKAGKKLSIRHAFTCLDKISSLFFRSIFRLSQNSNKRNTNSSSQQISLDESKKGNESVKYTQ